MSMQGSDQYGPSPASTAASPASQSPPGQKQASIPFVRASRRASQQDFAQSGTVTASSQQLGPFDIQTNGFLRFLELYTTVTTSGNSANTAYQPDAPFAALQNVTLQDPSSEFIINPYTGYELMLAEKYFAIEQAPYSDPRGDPNYFATTSTGGTGGSFGMVHRITAEDRQRDAFCALPNSAANKNYRLTAFFAPSATIYSTAPTTAGAFSVQCTNFYWTEPPTTIGNTPTVPTPNGNGSVAYLDREVFTAIGSQTNPTIILKNVGRVYKAAIFILRNSSNVRESTDWPDPLSIWLNGFPMYYKPKHTWLSEMNEFYGYSGASLDTNNNLDTGVFTWHDMIVQPGFATNWGSYDQVFATVASTKIQLVGNWGGGASSLTVLQRTIKPSSAQAMYS